jgi:predicted nucleic acid-binding Zn ribbon protein
MTSRPRKTPWQSIDAQAIPPDEEPSEVAGDARPRTSAAMVIACLVAVLIVALVVLFYAPA